MRNQLSILRNLKKNLCFFLGMPHRVPSPQELIVHTQQIMHAALIKKKLEEQNENYRKRQEMQR